MCDWERDADASDAYMMVTRWMDNDAYGHVNNVVYYSWFDTVVNEHLIRDGGLDIGDAPQIGLVVETSCRFHASLSFPETIEAGIVVTKLGTSSVVYGIGLFRQGEDAPAATHAGAAHRRAGVPPVGKKIKRPMPVVTRVGRAHDAPAAE